MWEWLQVLVAEEPLNPRRLVLSTKQLETLPGQLLDDAAAVYAAAERTVGGLHLQRVPLVSPFQAAA